MRLAAFALLACSTALLCGCPKKDAPPPPAAEAGAADAGADAATAGGDDVGPVYPVEANAPADPLAQKLCAAVHELPEKKRAACCKATPGIVTTAECVRTLSAAIRYKAVTIAEADVDACAAAFDKVLEGCDWVGPFPPSAPPACQGLVKGAIAAGQKCRSSLECEGTLRCLGAGPTTTGRCGPEKADGEPCGGTVDTLATYTRDVELDKRHPECRAKCIKHKCGAPVAEGGVCRTTADCAEGTQCIGGGATVGGGQPGKKCVAGPPPSKEGEVCLGGVCGGGLSCIRAKCLARKPTGEACTDDFECRGGCLKGDAGTGTCGPRCDVR